MRWLLLLWVGLSPLCSVVFFHFQIWNKPKKLFSETCQNSMGGRRDARRVFYGGVTEHRLCAMATGLGPPGMLGYAS